MPGVHINHHCGRIFGSKIWQKTFVEARATSVLLLQKVHTLTFLFELFLLVSFPGLSCG